MACAGAPEISVQTASGAMDGLVCSVQMLARLAGQVSTTLPALSSDIAILGSAVSA